jgi:hypothetical protein
MKNLALLFFILLCSLTGKAQAPKVRIYMEDVQDLVFPAMKIDLNTLYVERLMLRYTERPGCKSR